MENAVRQGRSLEETPTWSVASVTTVMVFVCLLVERSIYRFGKWLKKTRRKAVFASLEKIKEELMLLGLISLLLGQWASWISRICVNSSLFSTRFNLCSEEDYDEKFLFTKSFSSLNETDIPPGLNYPISRQCGEGHEPFVSYEGLEQLHRFLFVLGITHVLYSCAAVALAMSKIYSWRKWENQASLALDANLQVFDKSVLFDSKGEQGNQASVHLCFTSCITSLEQEPCSYLDALLSTTVQEFNTEVRLLGIATGFHQRGITNFRIHIISTDTWFGAWKMSSMEWWGSAGHSGLMPYYASLSIFMFGLINRRDLWHHVTGLNIYFWLSFIPAILVMLVGTKLQHVVSLLALETVEPKGKFVGTQVKPRDDLFWFGKPEILLQLIQFISFQNAFEMATFIWSLWGFKQRSCFMKNHSMIIIRLISGVLVQFWCSYSTVPLNVLITQMGSRCKKTVIAESVRESLHSWCKRVRERAKRDALHSVTTRSIGSLESIMDERDEIITVGSGTLSRCSSAGTLDHIEVNVPSDELGTYFEPSNPHQREFSFRIIQNPSEPLSNSSSEPLIDGAEDNVDDGEIGKAMTLMELFHHTD
ncbi:hypothetical protein RHMOL_Rhmol11G0188700 [Rhododendron molle]|uniref:Uncharacterized protein n=2 Tax=Rhododendron molle TaxID=49168 RepID=A0ACC0LUW0_RHOML|nr:hypothetical protein RHMOL_Rhmol11G0188700 [Rhododendron molle]KAI8532120.1 hypothetical protein RHMOL_Rhmol11G0188700 [Rhododendron molle]